MINGVEGDLFTNDAPSAQPALTAAWKWYQARCDTAGVQTFIKVIPIYGLPARNNNDITNECRISWVGCNDGQFEYAQPALPRDMISPKSIWRRQNQVSSDPTIVSDNSQGLQLMTQATDGLPAILDCNVYDWRDDGIYFYGTNYKQDWKFRYSAYRPALDITQPDSLVPMMMCEDCLGARVAFEYASSRGAVQAPAMEAWAETAFMTTSQRATRIKQRQSIRRIAYSGNGRNRGCYPNIPTN